VQSLQDFTLAFERWMERMAPSFGRLEPAAVARR
jgi:chromate reductase, NAD(P)H dehydrogenase (quinone)